MVITTLYAIPLAILSFILWMSVTKTRAATQVSIGSGGDTALHERIRRHGNFAESVPLVLILMGLAETGGAGALWLHMAGALLLLGRLLHPLGLKADNSAHPLRIAGNSLPLLATVILLALLVSQSLAALA